MPNEVRVVIYRIAGRQFFFRVPDSFCEECELMVGVVNRVVKELTGVPTRVEVKPWLNRMLSSLMRGGYHPPVLVVDGKLICQGKVPDPRVVRKSLLDAWNKRKTADRRETIVPPTRQRSVGRLKETGSLLDVSLSVHW